MEEEGVRNGGSSGEGNTGEARRGSPLSEGATRGGCSWCSYSGGELSDTQPHSLPGLCAVTVGLGVCAVPIVGLCRHCWGAGTPLTWDYDLANVDCRQLYSTCHCLQWFKQFALSVSTVCTRAGAVRGEISCSAEGVFTRDAGGGGPGGANVSGVNGEASCWMHQGAAATEPTQSIIITACAGR